MHSLGADADAHQTEISAGAGGAEGCTEHVATNYQKSARLPWRVPWRQKRSLSGGNTWGKRSSGMHQQFVRPLRLGKKNNELLLFLIIEMHFYNLLSFLFRKKKHKKEKNGIEK